MRNIKFLFDVAIDDAVSCYSLLNGFVRNLEQFFHDCRDMLSLEISLQENGNGSNEKLATFRLQTVKGEIAETGRATNTEDAMWNAFDKVQSRFSALV